MKRIISIICASIMILSLFQIVYAGADNGQGGKGFKEEQKIEEDKGSKEISVIKEEDKVIKNDKGSKGNQELKDEVNDLSEQIKQNKQELLDLREKMTIVTLDIQSKVKQSFSDKTSITQAEVANLKTVLSIVKKSKKGLRGFKSDGLKQNILDGKSARDNKELRKAKGHMDKVVALQQNRKLILNDIISNLDTANQLLSQDKKID